MKVVVSLCVVTIGSAFLISAAQAQVVPDGSLNTTVNAVGNNFTIDNGTTSGSNLFHSFREFSLPTGGAAIFNNATNIQNIFSRVTGGNVSNIDGVIQANGTANLFLLNPNGILFGPNAALNLGGSFLGTTASSIKFADGAEFGASNQAPLLTMSVPIGLQFGSNPAAIGLQGNSPAPMINSLLPIFPPPPTGLQVRPANTLALVGGDITLTGGSLGAWGGNVELGSVQNAATISIIPTPSGFTLAYPNGSTFGNLQLAQSSFVAVGPGSLNLQAKTLRLTEGSVILAQNPIAQPGGALTIRSTDSIELSGTSADRQNRSAIISQTLGLGQGSDLSIATGQLILQDAAIVGTTTFSPATGGKVEINASNSVKVSGFKQINPTDVSVIASGSFANGQSGTITVNTPRLLIENGAAISAASFGTGVGGNLQINTALAEIVGASPAYSASGISATNLGAGTAGNIELNTGILRIRDGGSVNTASINDGNAGNIDIRASESIEATGAFAGIMPSEITSSVAPAPALFQQLYRLPAIPKGQAGEVSITTPHLQITDGATVTVANLGLGNAGNLEINADRLILDRGKIEAATLKGTGGNILLQTQLLKLRNLSQVTTTASGNGKGGDILINSPIILGLDNSDIIANAVQGRGGNINITTQGIIGLKFHNTLTPRQDPTNDITASSEFNVNGSVQIDNIGVDPNSGLVALPVDIVDPTQQISKGCNASQGSRFVATGRGGIPNNPAQHIQADRPWSDLRSIEPTGTTTATNPTQTPQFGEASTWAKDPQTGQIQILAAQPWANASIATCGAIDAPN